MTGDEFWSELVGEAFWELFKRGCLWWRWWWCLCPVVFWGVWSSPGIVGVVPLRPEGCQCCLVDGLRDDEPEGLLDFSSVDSYEARVSFEIVDFVASSNFETEDACSAWCSR